MRAKQLGISYCLVGIKDKPRALAQLQNDLRIGQQHTAFIGDDLNDLAVRKQTNLLITPADACSAVRRQADWVLSRNGRSRSCSRSSGGDLEKPWRLEITPRQRLACTK